MLMLLATILCLALCCLGQNVQTVVVPELGESRTLNCTPGDYIRPSGFYVWHWILSNMAVLPSTSDNSNPKIVMNGWRLHISSIGYEHLGEYICVLKEHNGNTVEYRKTVLQLRRRSMWELYRMNVIIGVTSALALLLIMIGVCLVYHYRWQPETQGEIHVYQGTPPSRVRDFANAAYDEVTVGHEKAGPVEKKIPPPYAVVVADTKM